MEEGRAASRKKAESTGTPTLDADAPRGLTRSEVSDARNRRKHGRDTNPQEWHRGLGTNQSYLLAIGMEGATERKTKL